MTQTTAIDQKWLKVLGKGMVTLPKKWREALGIEEGDVVKAKKEGKRIVIETKQQSLPPYRVYSNKEIDEFLRDDVLDESLAQKVRTQLSS